VARSIRELDLLTVQAVVGFLLKRTPPPTGNQPHEFCPNGQVRRRHFGFFSNVRVVGLLSVVNILFDLDSLIGSAAVSFGNRIFALWIWWWQSYKYWILWQTTQFSRNVAAVVDGSTSATWMNASVGIMTAVFSPVFSHASDLWGRKWFIVISGVAGLAGCLIVGKASSMNMAIAGEVLAGLSYGAQVAVSSISSITVVRYWYLLIPSPCFTLFRPKLFTANTVPMHRLAPILWVEGEDLRMWSLKSCPCRRLVLVDYSAFSWVGNWWKTITMVSEQ
jgi:hypothetical protein